MCTTKVSDRADCTGTELGKQDEVQVTAPALPFSKNVGHWILIMQMSLLPFTGLCTNCRKVGIFFGGLGCEFNILTS